MVCSRKAANHCKDSLKTKTNQGNGMVPMQGCGCSLFEKKKKKKKKCRGRATLNLFQLGGDGLDHQARIGDAAAVIQFAGRFSRGPAKLGR